MSDGRRAITQRADPTGVVNLVFSGLGPSMAAVFSNPLDVARVNMQINGEGGGTKAYKNTFDCMAQIARTSGISGLQRGLTTAFLREFMQNVPRLGLYQPLMTTWREYDGTLGNGTPDPFLKRLCVASFCGAFGGVFSNPAEIVKARVQSGRYSYTGPFNGLGRMVKDEGMLSIYKGCDASAVRCMVGTSSQLIAQTYAKDAIVETAWYKRLDWSPTAKQWLAYCVSGLISGVCLSCAMQPFDTARTRLYSQPTNPDGTGTLYRSGVLGMFDALQKTARLEGVSGLYKGLLGNILRQGPHMAIAFSFVSLLKSAYGTFYSRPRELDAVWSQMDTAGAGSVEAEGLVSFLARAGEEQRKHELIAQSVYIDDFIGRSIPGAYHCTVDRLCRDGGEIRFRFVTRGPKVGEKGRLGPVQPADASKLTVDSKPAKLLRLRLDVNEDTCVSGELIYTDPCESKTEAGPVSHMVFEYGTNGYRPVRLEGRSGLHVVAHRLLNYADRDRDGKVSREEFELCLEGLDYCDTANVVEHMFLRSGVASM